MAEQGALAAYRADAGTEQQHQEWLFDVIRRYEERYPVLKLCFHTPNEGRHTPAYRAKQARQGVRAGVPDVLLPVPHVYQIDDEYADESNGASILHLGLAIELKVGKNKATPAQKEFMYALSNQHWLCVVRYSWQQAWDTIRWYLRIPDEVTA